MDIQDIDSKALPTWNDRPVDITITDKDGNPMLNSLVDTDPESRNKIHRALTTGKSKMVIDALKRRGITSIEDQPAKSMTPNSDAG